MRKNLNKFLSQNGLTLTNALIALGFAAIIAFVVLRIRSITACPVIDTLETVMANPSAVLSNTLAAAVDNLLL